MAEVPVSVETAAAGDIGYPIVQNVKKRLQISRLHGACYTFTRLFELRHNHSNNSGSQVTPAACRAVLLHGAPSFETCITMVALTAKSVQVTLRFAVGALLRLVNVRPSRAFEWSGRSCSQVTAKSFGVTRRSAPADVIVNLC